MASDSAENTYYVGTGVPFFSKKEVPRPPGHTGLPANSDPRVHSNNPSGREPDYSQMAQSPAQQQSSKNEVPLVYQSAVMDELVKNTIEFAKSSATVLLTGESGTGKEMFAKLVHAHSRRADKRFVRVNCAALSESLLESEFFGHERGAFTGAVERRIGRFEWADGGTILLDEVSEIPIQLQAKLLRVLEENEFQRVGSNQDRLTNVRVVATSNRDLQIEVQSGRFRNDLYHRLNVLQIEIPPLRERTEDIPVLVDLFVRMFRNEGQYCIRDVAPSAMEKLSAYSWPGNVRQLRNVIHRGCVAARSHTITSSDLPQFKEPTKSLPSWLMELDLAEIERHVILSNLNRFNGNKTRTAKHLSVTPRTLSNKMKLYREKGLLQTDNGAEQQ